MPEAVLGAVALTAGEKAMAQALMVPVVKRETDINEVFLLMKHNFKFILERKGVRPILR